MTRHEVILPDLGLDNQPISAGLWLVERGRRVAAGDQILEILAGSVVLDLSAPADGVLREKLVEEDSPLQTGQRLAVIESGDDPA
jgi:pyruvate/2-oxoglutarate dehydrogenase complex dihydrolipoamide acyltransferase (E2) component